MNKICTDWWLITHTKLFCYIVTTDLVDLGIWLLESFWWSAAGEVITAVMKLKHIHVLGNVWKDATVDNSILGTRLNDFFADMVQC